MLSKTPRFALVAGSLAAAAVAVGTTFVATQTGGDADAQFYSDVAAARQNAAADTSRSAPREPVPVALSQALTDQKTAAVKAAEAKKAAEEAAAKKAAEEAAAKKAAEEAAAKKAAEEAAARKAAEEAAAKKAEEAAVAAARAEQESRTWVAPLTDYRITAGFGSSGRRWSSTHTGLDFAAPAGTEVRSVAAGTITFAGWDGPYGNKIEVRHGDGTVTWYAHLSAFVRSDGDGVGPGDVIGRVGSTGNSTGPHMHLEVHPGGGAAVDPRRWLADHGVGV